MKLAIYNDEPVEEEKRVFLKLIPSYSGAIMLSAVNKAGVIQECGNLIKIFPNGTFVRMPGALIGDKAFEGGYGS